MSNHLDHKYDFLKKQDTNKWNNWLRKSPEIFKNLSDRKNRENFKCRQNRRKRDCEKQAKKVLEDGSVVILTDQQQIGDIPMGAISVLGKGLGFVLTPELDVMDNRLDMRLTVNRILSSSKSNLKRDSTENNNNSINPPPPKITREFVVPSKIAPQELL